MPKIKFPENIYIFLLTNQFIYVIISMEIRERAKTVALKGQTARPKNFQQIYKKHLTNGTTYAIIVVPREREVNKNGKSKNGMFRYGRHYR